MSDRHLDHDPNCIGPDAHLCPVCGRDAEGCDCRIEEVAQAQHDADMIDARFAELAKIGHAARILASVDSTHLDGDAFADFFAAISAIKRYSTAHSGAHYERSVRWQRERDESLLSLLSEAVMYSRLADAQQGAQLARGAIAQVMARIKRDLGGE